jgi:hypothetical protein
MKLTYKTGPCNGGPCPAVYITEHGTQVVQGYTLTGRKGEVVVPRNMVDGYRPGAARRVTGEALAVRGTPVDPAQTTGLHDIVKGEALVEVPEATFETPDEPRLMSAEELAAWRDRAAGSLDREVGGV